MNVSFNEDFEHYSAEITCEDVQDLETFPFDIVSAFVDKARTYQLPVSIMLSVDEDIYYNGVSYNDFKEELLALSSSIEGSELLLTIKVNKPSDILYIFSCDLFVEYLVRFDFPLQLKLIKKHFVDNALRVDDMLIDMSSNQGSNPKLVFGFDTISDRELRSGSSPISLQALASKTACFPALSKYFSQVRDMASLVLLSERVDFDHTEIDYHFSSDSFIRSSEMFTGELFVNSIYETMLWVFEDDSYNIKKGIFNNVISHQSNVVGSLNSRLLPILKSNLRIVYHENYKGYLQAKNELSDFLFELSNKLREQISSNVSSAHTSILAVLTFFFTSTVFTAIDKGKFENIFTYEVSVLSTVFITGAMIYLSFEQRNFERFLAFHKSQKDEFKDRYRDVFSEEELDELFSPPSLMALIKDAESRDMFFAYQFILVILFIVSWAMYSI